MPDQIHKAKVLLQNFEQKPSYVRVGNQDSIVSLNK